MITKIAFRAVLVLVIAANAFGHVNVLVNRNGLLLLAAAWPVRDRFGGGT